MFLCEEAVLTAKSAIVKTFHLPNRYPEIVHNSTLFVGLMKAFDVEKCAGVILDRVEIFHLTNRKIV